MKIKILKIIYIVVFALAFAAPGVLSLARGEENIGNERKEELADLNYLNFAEKFDGYFSENFGFRNALVDMNNRLKYSLFRQSGEDLVIAGRDGWLFYKDALPDFTGEGTLSDEQIGEIADMLRDAQNYARSVGTEFVFIAAPNKMEIYGENMPYYCVEDGKAGNYEKLMAALEERDVSHVDLKAVLKSAKESMDTPLYHKLDTHWNNLGAGIAYGAVMERLGLEASDYSRAGYSVRNIFDGDLYGMLFPRGTKKDAQIVFDVEEKFYYTSSFRSSDDLIISTVNEEGKGSIRMFRDSFGNAFYPLVANDFEKAEFSRALPYDLTGIGAYDAVIIEIVERSIPNLLAYPLVLEADR